MWRDRFERARPTADSPTFIAGLDLGQSRDYTALAVLQRHEESEPASYDVVHLERVRGVLYPQIVRDTRDRLAAIDDQRPRPHLSFAVDGTGVGQAVIDQFAEADLPCAMTAITITGGDTVTRDGAAYRVPKRDLAGVVQVLLHAKRLRIADSLPLARVLTDELTNFRVKISLTGHDSYGAGADWRDGNHDDLVLAVAIGVWLGEQSAGLDFAPLDPDVAGWFRRHGFAPAN